MRALSFTAIAAFGFALHLAARGDYGAFEVLAICGAVYSLTFWADALLRRRAVAGPSPEAKMRRRLARFYRRQA